MFLNMGEVRWGEGEGGGMCIWQNTLKTCTSGDLQKGLEGNITRKQDVLCIVLVSGSSYIPMSSYILICSILKYILSYMLYLARSSFSIEEPISKNSGLP